VRGYRRLARELQRDCRLLAAGCKQQDAWHIIEPEKVTCSMEKSFETSYELVPPLTRDLVNKLAVIVGHCDLLREHLKAGSPSAKRVDAIQEIARGMANELNEYQCRLAEWTRSAEMQKRGVA
jgi:hypothetical protein